jgi:hypothetical protein
MTMSGNRPVVLLMTASRPTGEKALLNSSSSTTGSISSLQEVKTSSVISPANNPVFIIIFFIDNALVGLIAIIIFQRAVAGIDEHLPDRPELVLIRIIRKERVDLGSHPACQGSRRQY